MWPTLFLLACQAPGPAQAPDPPPRANSALRPGEALWPAAGAPLSSPMTPEPRAQPWRVSLDPGHGAPGNEGNTGVRCQVEAEQTLRFAEPLAEALEQTGAFEVRLSREGEQRPGYRERAAAADAWPAEVLLSLHTDARYDVIPDPLPDCPRVEGAHGFSVLWSDEGPTALVEQRRGLARALAGRLAEAGFTPYDGAFYQGIYARDEAHAGVFLDRHEPARRVFMLRGPKTPSVILELHHALDPLEVQRWEEEATWEAFHAAVAAGLADALTGPTFSPQDVVESAP